MAQFPWGGGNAAWIGEIFPPISTAIAAVTPGGRLGLSIIGAVAAGIVLQKVVEILVQRRVPVSTTTPLLVIALGLNPLFFYTALENLPAFLGLSFFGTRTGRHRAIRQLGEHAVRFPSRVVPDAGDDDRPSAGLYVVAAVVAASFLRLSRTGQRGARSCQYPSSLPGGRRNGVYLVAGHHVPARPLGLAATDVFAGSHFGLDSLVGVFQTPYGGLLIASVATAWLDLLVVRRSGGIIVATLAFAALMVGFILGWSPPESSGNTFMMMTMLCIALIPTARVPGATRLVGLVAVVQIVIAWIAVIEHPAVADWLTTLIGATGSLVG